MSSAGVLQIFQSILNSNEETFDEYLQAIKEQQSFQDLTQNRNNVVQTITTLLTKQNTRIIGIKLLNVFLEQCPNDVITERGNLWTTLTLKACNKRNLEEHSEIIFSVLSIFAIKSKESAEFCKAFGTTQLPKIFEILALVSPQTGYESALKCVETCLRAYAGPSGPVKSNVDRFLNNFIDTSDEILNRLCAKCHHLLLQVRGGGAQGANHKTQWKNYQISLLGNLHNSMDLVFAKCNELYDGPIVQLNDDDVKLFKGLELSDEPVQRAMQIYIRFRNLVYYLQHALCEPFPVAKPIAMKKILNVISRGLATTCQVLQRNPISDNLAMMALLPKMQYHLLGLLQTLILTLRGYLLTHHKLILDILGDTLKFTSPKNHKSSKNPYRMLRGKTYELLTLWGSTFKSGSCLEMQSEFYIGEILQDIVPCQNEVKLTVLSGARKHMSKKARRQLHSANQQSNMAKTHGSGSSVSKRESLSDENDQKLCCTALSFLQQLLNSSAIFIKPTLLKLIEIRIIEISAVFYELSLERQQFYSNWRCRLEIYNTLYVLLWNPHQLCPQPTEMSLSILKSARIRDPTTSVRRQCCQILQNLEKLVHPQKEGLMFPPDLHDIKNAFNKLKMSQLMTSGLVKTAASHEKETISNGQQNYEEEKKIEKDSLQEKNQENIHIETIESSNNINLGSSDDDNETVEDDVDDVTGHKNDDESDSELLAPEDDSSKESFKDIANKSSNGIAPPARRNDNTNLRENNNENEDEDNDDDEDMNMPKNKKQKLDEIDNATTNNNSIDEIDEDQLLADIEAEFYDELN